MKTITKKEIARVLRTQDSTQIYKLCFILTGSRRWTDVCSFIKENAPTKRVRLNAYNIAQPRKKYYCGDAYKGTHGHFEPMPRQSARLFFTRERDRGADSYTKVAMLGDSWLYGCSPVYGHRDYNKARILPIAGNERTCELLIKKFSII